MTDPPAESRKPIEQAIDVLFFAPLGFVTNARELLPDLVARGRRQINTARVFGEFAVQRGHVKVEEFGERFPGPASDLLNQVFERATGRPSTPARAAAPAPAPAGTREPEPATAAVADPVAPAPPAELLAIPEYDSLAASQVVTRLAGLSSSELEAVRADEAGNRNRKTILNKVAELQDS